MPAVVAATNTTTARNARASRPLVERPAPGRAPVAFRIWASGRNLMDDGQTVVFSERSAEALLAEQASRGRLYSFDFDHRSMMPDVSPEAGRAAGWHVLDVRKDENSKPELWASSCDWTAGARAGLEATPPDWRYFSPCYEVDPATREVVSYVGCALTNNPLTHGTPALASAAGDASSAKPGRVGMARARVGVVRLRSRQCEMASATGLLAQIKALTARLAKVEKASAIAAARAALRAIPRPGSTKRDFAIEELQRAERNHLRSLGRDVPMPRG